jgi:acyl dehydratase
MPIDPAATGSSIPGGTHTWDRDRIILYHLGVGAGVPQTDPNELSYTYEKNLKVLPSWGVIPAFGAMGSLGAIPGMQFNPALLLHGEQDLEVHKAIPVAATVTTSGKIAGIYDKGKAALVVLEMVTKDDGGDPLFTNRFSLFIRGEGGWGGDPGPRPAHERPEREPDLVVESKTLPQQALLYRLSGDKNPLHADPEFAKLGGFDRPIIHGLCSYGIACKAIVDEVLGGDVARVARYQARFAGVAFPGETYRISYWKDGAKRILLEAGSVQRDAKIISNAVIELR